MGEQRGAMVGVWPEIGDLAWLNSRVHADYQDRPEWFRVLGVRYSTVAGWVYLDGYHRDEAQRELRSVFVRVESLVIRRGEV